MCLVMDVARFKYPPHWVRTEVLYDAMSRIDKTCAKTRGWIVISNAEMAKSYYFTFNTAAISADTALLLNDKLCCCSSRFVASLAHQSQCLCGDGGGSDQFRKSRALQVVRC